MQRRTFYPSAVCINAIRGLRPAKPPSKFDNLKLFKTP